MSESAAWQPAAAGSPAAQRIRVRAHECDSFGHVNNAVYLEYLQQATLDALGWSEREDGVWNVRRLAIEYHVPARYQDELDVATWPVETRACALVRACTLTRPTGARRVASAEIELEYLDRATWHRRSVPRGADLPAGLASPIRGLRVPHDNGARPFRWSHRVHRYELDATGRVALASYFNWLEEATYRAADVVGWSLERMRVEDVLSVQYRHDAEFFEAAASGDEIEVVSKLVEARRLRGTWVHEVVRRATGTLLARDYSTGTFLDWTGALRAAPPALMAALVQGEPAVVPSPGNRRESTITDTSPGAGTQPKQDGQHAEPHPASHRLRDTVT